MPDPSSQDFKTSAVAADTICGFEIKSRDLNYPSNANPFPTRERAWPMSVVQSNLTASQPLYPQYPLTTSRHSL